MKNVKVKIAGKRKYDDTKRAKYLWQKHRQEILKHVSMFLGRYGYGKAHPIYAFFAIQSDGGGTLRLIMDVFDDSYASPRLVECLISVVFGTNYLNFRWGKINECVRANIVTKEDFNL